MKLRFPFGQKISVFANLTYHTFEYYYPEFCIENFKAFLLGDMDCTPPPPTFFLRKKKKNNWLKKNLVTLVELRCRDNIFFFKRIGKQLYFFSKAWKTNYFFRQSFFPYKNSWPPCPTPEYQMVAAQALCKIKKKMVYLPTPFFNM